VEHEGVHIAELVTGITLLMLVAAVTTMLSKRIDKLPLLRTMCRALGL
jgi:hypothetical protein